MVSTVLDRYRNPEIFRVGDITEYGIERQRKELGEVLDHSSRWHIVGHCVGGTLAATYLDYETVESVTAIDPVPGLKVGDEKLIIDYIENNNFFGIYSDQIPKKDRLNGEYSELTVDESSHYFNESLEELEEALETAMMYHSGNDLQRKAADYPNEKHYGKSLSRTA